MEKTVTKSLCKVLEGLSQNPSIALPDAVNDIEERAKQRGSGGAVGQQSGFSALLDELVGQVKDTDEAEDEEMLDSEPEVAEKETDVIQIDRKSKVEASDGAPDSLSQIQMKL